MLRNMTSVYIINDKKILMLYRIGSRVVPPSWCGIGGHFEKEEINDPQSCVLRELYEEIGLRKEDIKNLELRYITMRLKNDEIRQNYYYFANLENLSFIFHKCDEGILEWVDIDKVLEREMPISARFCLEHYFNCGKYNKKKYAGITTKTGIDFVELCEF